MPMYEYACRGCGHEFETLVRAGSNPECPTCHSKELEKLLSVDVREWASNIEDIKNFLEQFGPHTPKELWDEYNKLTKIA